MLCHSVRRCCSPERSLKTSSVARVNLATGAPLGVYLTSGSLPRRPIRMTLLMELIAGTSAVVFFDASPHEPDRGPRSGRIWLAAARRRGSRQFLQPLTRQFRLTRVRVALHQRAQFARSSLRLPQVDQRVALLELRRGQLVARRVALDALVVLVDRLLVVALAVIALADIELGVRGEVGIGIVLEILLERLDGEVILAAVVIRQSLLVERIGVGDVRPRRRVLPGSRGRLAGSGRAAARRCALPARRGTRGGRSLRRIQRLDDALRLGDLVIELGEARFGLLQ